jgi:hypothetical protein
VKIGTTIITSIGGAMATASTAAATLWGTVTAAIGTGLTAAASLLTATTGWIMALAAPIVTPIAAAIGAAFAAMPFLPVVLAGLAIIGILSVVLPPETKEKISKMLAAVLNLDGSTLNADIPVDAMAEMQKLSVMIPENVMGDAAAQVYGDINKQLMFITPEDAGSKLNMVTSLEKLTVDYQSGAIDLADFQKKTKKVIDDALYGIQNMDTSGDRSEYETPVSTILKPPDASKAKAVADGMLNPVWTQVAANIAAQSATGNMDTTVLATGLTTPFIDKFTEVFGTTGTATTKFQEFINSFNTGADANQKKLVDMTAKVVTWAAVALASNTIAIASFAGYNGIRTLLQGVQSDADKLGATLNSLVLHSPYLVKVNIETTGGAPTLPAGAKGSDDDGHHATGLYDVPKDNYKADLHKGEAVLDKQTAAVWRAIPQMVANMHTIRNDDKQGQNNTIIINGVQDVDTMLRELNRRGIKIGNQR